MNIASIILSAFTLTACASNTGTGVIAGGILGATAGIAANSGKGALIGSAAGIIAGGLIGAALDQQERKVMERSSPRTIDRMDRGDPLTINDVIRLSQSGVSDDTILDYMTDTESTYHLSKAQVRRLQDAGVSQRVIDTMADSGKRG